MYLERYRRTKVSNILKAADGRVLPAMHADGSVVQIRAIITRADDDTSSNMLFKGTIQRIDTSVQNLARPGFRNENVIEITKTGIIQDINRSILKGLGYENSVPLEAFIGQSIEVIFPPMDTRATQMKEYWMPKCLADSNSNFYLLAVNRNLSVIPVTINVSMKSSDIVLVRMADLSGLDALITIDEMGMILNFNEDAFLLLGHESDEAIGRNIKFMLVKEIADQHDYFLQRYRETRVARVVGIPRTLNSIHRDKSVLPIEIQVSYSFDFLGDGGNDRGGPSICWPTSPSCNRR
jgi:PAS domain S-box-containing protein